MEFVVYRRRENGRARPGIIQAVGTEVRGHLMVDEVNSKGLDRRTRCAWLVDAGGAPLADPPPLHDFTLVKAKPDWWVLSGIELVDVYGHLMAFGQTWVMVPGPVFDGREAQGGVRGRLATTPTSEG